MLEALLIERPSDTLAFLATYLERVEDEGILELRKVVGSD